MINFTYWLMAAFCFKPKFSVSRFAASVLIICTSTSLFGQSTTEPKIFQSGIISTGQYESHIAFMPDGKELYFVKSAPDFSSWTICVSFFANGKWSEPKIAPFSGQWNDADPFITADGKRLYFISTRPIVESDSVEKDLDIWYVPRMGNKWGEAVRLDTSVNSSNNEWYPTLAANGNLYFGSERLGGLGRSDIYFCRNEGGAFTQRTHILDSVSTRFTEFEPFIFPNETEMIFMGVRPGGKGQNDFYYTFKDTTGRWVVPANISELNSPGSEFSPSITSNGKLFFFASTRVNIKRGKKLDFVSYTRLINAPGNGLGDIYYITRRELENILKKYRGTKN